MHDFGRCEKEVRRRLIVQKEKGKKFTVRNPDQARVRVIQIDGCVLDSPSDGPRCDWLFIPVEGDAVEIYVELKGSDVGRGIKQLESTVQNPEVTEGVRTVPKSCYVVSGSNPLLSTNLQKAKKRFRRDYLATLIVKNRQAEHDLIPPP